MARLFRRGRVWHAWIGKPGGGTVRVSTNCADRKAAEKRAAELERDSVDPAHAAASKADTATACTEFLASRARRGRAAGTVGFYRTKLGHAVRLLPGRLAQIDAASCERFIEKRLSEGAAQTTVKKEIRAIGSMLRHAKRQGLYARDMESVLPELDETYAPRTRALSPWELVALASALGPRRASHVVFIVCTGARWSESVRAQRGDVDGQMVFLRGTKTARAVRTVPVPPTMRAPLAWALAHAPADLFDRWTNVRRELNDACDAAGIARVTPNDLRRTFATWLRQSGVTPDIIGAALGHTTSRMAEVVYGRIKPADLDRLISERDPMTVLLMSCDVAEKSSPEPIAETAKTGESPEKQGGPSGTRTRDLRIKSPSQSPRNIDNSPASGEDRAANVLAFRRLAHRWLTRVAA